MLNHVDKYPASVLEKMWVILAVTALGFCEIKVNKSNYSQFHAMSRYCLFCLVGQYG